ncbi:MAG: hypothetical protein H6810_09365 [Phycisphaeraceae bacterium]|nr:MAG: hypothetical protein H6810_09365 [Phycisphaeraceae bacterium]
MRLTSPALAATLPALLAGTTLSMAERFDVPANFTSIQAAIGAANPGDEIVVAAGEYSGPIRIDKAVTVRSQAGAGQTTLRGNGGSPVVTMESTDGQGGTLAGFTVTGGGGENGGGLFLAGDVAVVDCNVTGNSAQNGGGAFLLGSPMLNRVHFEANSASAGGAVFLGPDADALMDNCAFTANEAQLGGALYVGPGRDGNTFATIGAGSFESNTADEGGAIMAVMSGFEAGQSTFSRNTSWMKGGAVRLVGSTPCALTECTMSLNESDTWGGAVDMSEQSDLYVAGCEVSQNTAQAAGGGFEIEPGSALAVVASTLWGNQPGNFEGVWEDLGDNSFAQPPACDADLAAPFGVLDMADILAFVSAFAAEDAAADFAAPEGLFDLRDVIEFINQYFAGCAR